MLKKIKKIHKRDGHGEQGGTGWGRVAWQMILEGRPKGVWSTTVLEHGAWGGGQDKEVGFES